MRRRFPAKAKPAVKVDPAALALLRERVASLDLDELHDARAHGLVSSLGVPLAHVVAEFARERRERSAA